MVPAIMQLFHFYATGLPLPDPTRAGSCIGILAGKKEYMFDVGAGGVRYFGMMRFPLQRLDVTFLTHLHVVCREVVI